MSPAGDNWGSVWRQVGIYLGLAMTVPAAALIGFAVGYEIDGHMGGGHTFTVIFVLLGCAAGMVEIVRTVGRDKSA